MAARYTEIFTLFNRAVGFLRYPAMNFRSKNGDNVRIYLATKGYIAIKLNGEYIGKLPAADKNIILYDSPLFNHAELISELEAFMEKPISESAIRGKEYGRCCFCNRELDNEGSIFHGYGPICAEKWGLPWLPVMTNSDWLDCL